MLVRDVLFYEPEMDGRTFVFVGFTKVSLEVSLITPVKELGV